jgi:hypothetical protein
MPQRSQDARTVELTIHGDRETRGWSTQLARKDSPFRLRTNREAAPKTETTVLRTLGQQFYLPFFFDWIISQLGTHFCMQKFIEAGCAVAQRFSRQNFSQPPPCAEAANVPSNVMTATSVIVRMVTSER